MKKIGFIDYYISEWHANNYPIWFREICKKTGQEFEVAYVWAEVDVSVVDGRTTDEWCRDFGVERCETIAELCQKSDCILILSPSNPEKHLGYAKEALTFGKPTYIDKTFAPDYATASEIFSIAKQNNTPFFSSSALRYADELKGIKADALVTTGGGSNYEEYIIHQIEMAVKLLGIGVQKVKVEKSGKQYVSYVTYSGGKEAVLMYGEAYPFTVHVNKADGGTAYLPIQSEFFYNLLCDILNFYKTKETSFCGEETLEVMKIREALINAKENLGNWVCIHP